MSADLIGTAARAGRLALVTTGTVLGFHFSSAVFLLCFLCVCVCTDRHVRTKFIL